MKLFGFYFGTCLILAVIFVGVVMLNKMLADQKKAVCYVGMTVMDVVVVGYIGVCMLRFYGIL